MVPIASHTHPANLYTESECICICIVQVKHLVYMDKAYKTQSQSYKLMITKIKNEKSMTVVV